MSVAVSEGRRYENAPGRNLDQGRFSKIERSPRLPKAGFRRMQRTRGFSGNVTVPPGDGASAGGPDCYNEAGEGRALQRVAGARAQDIRESAPILASDEVDHYVAR